MKPFLLSIREIIDYEISINPHMDEEFIEMYLIDNFGMNASAQLISIDLLDIVISNPDNHLEDPATQVNYNLKNNHPPILIDDLRVIIDGHHRYRDCLAKNRRAIMAYQIIPENK